MFNMEKRFRNKIIIIIIIMSTAVRSSTAIAQFANSQSKVWLQWWVGTLTNRCKLNYQVKHLEQRYWGQTVCQSGYNLLQKAHHKKHMIITDQKTAPKTLHLLTFFVD